MNLAISLLFITGIFIFVLLIDISNRLVDLEEWLACILPHANCLDMLLKGKVKHWQLKTKTYYKIIEFWKAKVILS